MTPLVATTINRKRIPLHLRAALADLAESCSALRADAAEGSTHGIPVVLDTCERFELYHRIGDAVAERVLREATTSRLTVSRYHRQEALRHLFRVASGLESRILGEPQVLGQLRSALDSAHQAGVVDPIVTDAIASATRCARRVRRRLFIHAPRVDYASLAIEQLDAWLGSPRSAPITVVGTGVLAHDLLHRLRHTDTGVVTIVGRNLLRLRALTEQYRVTPVFLSDYLIAPRKAAAILSAVTTRTPFLTSDRILHTGATLLIDLGATPTLDPAVTTTHERRVLRLEDLRAPTLDDAVTTHATDLVNQAVKRYLTVRVPSLLSRVRSTRIAA